MPAGESSSISDSQQSIQMHGTQNKIEGFIKDLEELRKFVRESRAKGRDEAVERADKLIKDMRNYATAQVDTSRLLTNIGQEIQTKITQQIQHQFQALQTNLKDNKTWAQVAATPPSQPENRSVSMEKREEVERTRKQRAEYEMTLTAAASPTEVKGSGQGRGNSGVYLSGRYEVQVLDSYNNKTYVNGQAGSIYKQSIPLANPTRKPGEWQIYDVVWTAPTFNSDGSLKTPAFVTAFFNGVLVQNHFELKGDTKYIGKPSYTKHDAAPIRLQAHGDPSLPISFRNIWLRELE